MRQSGQAWSIGHDAEVSQGVALAPAEARRGSDEAALYAFDDHLVRWCEPLAGRWPLYRGEPANLASLGISIRLGFEVAVEVVETRVPTAV